MSRPTASPPSAPPSAPPAAAAPPPARGNEEGGGIAPFRPLTPPPTLLIGGVADGRRIAKPFGSYHVAATSWGEREAYSQRRVYLSAGHPVEFWAAVGLTDEQAVRRLLEGYRERRDT